MASCCPFCGAPDFDHRNAEEPTEENTCKHFLYHFAEGEYVYLSNRFAEAEEDESRFEIVIRFEINLVSDLALSCFACFKDELSFWGNDDVKSPYHNNKKGQSRE